MARLRDLAHGLLFRRRVLVLGSWLALAVFATEVPPPDLFELLGDLDADPGDRALIDRVLADPDVTSAETSMLERDIGEEVERLRPLDSSHLVTLGLDFAVLRGGSLAHQGREIKARVWFGIAFDGLVERAVTPYHPPPRVEVTRVRRCDSLARRSFGAGTRRTRNGTRDGIQERAARERAIALRCAWLSETIRRDSRLGAPGDAWVD